MNTDNKINIDNILNASKHPFIEIIRYYVNNKRVVIQYYELITDNVYTEIMQNNYLSGKEQIKSKTQVIQFMNNNYKGYASNNYIYIKKNMNNLHSCATIAHEFIHYLRSSNLHYDTLLKKFKEEFIADIIYNQILNTRFTIMSIANEIKRDYEFIVDINIFMLNDYYQEYCILIENIYQNITNNKRKRE